MKLQIRTTFDFGKLASKMDSIVNDVVDDGKRLYRTTTRENLKEGRLRKLKPYSIEARKQGLYWRGKSGDSHHGDRKVSATTSTKPLVYTARLLKSIKVVKDGVEMNDYGLNHQEGFFIPMKRAGVTFNQKVAPRRFFALKLDGKRVKGTKYGKAYDKFIDKMYKRIGKALKK